MSASDLRYYVMAVKSPEQPGTTRGTAFLVSHERFGYVVTCYHAIRGRTQVELYFEPTERSILAELVPEYSNAEMDLAILRLLEPPPIALQMLHLSSEECRNREFESYGFPRGFNGLRARGTVEGLVAPPPEAPRTLKEGLLQLRTTDVEEGMSGAPVVLSTTETAVGMIIAGNRTQWNIHADLAFAQPIDAVLKLCEALIVPSLIQSREEWLDYLKLNPDPFLYTDGGHDPHLSKYFYRVPNFLEIVGQASRPETILVFGAQGSGKSSLRSMVEQMCRTGGAGGAVLPVPYLDFGPLVDQLEEGHRIQAKDHVAQILKAAVDALAEEVETCAISQPRLDRSTKVARNYLWAYVSEYGADPVRKQELQDILEPSKDTSEALPLDYRDLLGTFCRLVQIFGYSCVYFLVDPDEDISPEVDVAWEILSPLLSARRLLKLSKYGGAFKFFLNQRFMSLALAIPWIRRERGKIIYHRPLDWTEEKLRALLRERLRLCSAKSPPYVSLGELSEVEDLDDIVIRRSRGKPRELITICDRLFRVHCRLPFNRDRIFITREEVKEALEQLDIGEQESLGTRVLRGEESLNTFTIAELIAQGENNYVEFKSTMRWNVHTGKTDKNLEKAIAKTLSGFMNAEGGILIIGVGDEGNVLGLTNDFSTLRKQNEDGFELALTDIVQNYMGVQYRRYVHLKFVEIQGKLVCAVRVERSHEPVYLKGDEETEFYVRVGNSTRKWDVKDIVDYVLSHWGKDRSTDRA